MLFLLVALRNFVQVVGVAFNLDYSYALYLDL